MVHNGIEYGDMQLICEVYHIMKDILKMSNNEIAEVKQANNIFDKIFFELRHLKNGIKEH